jgi:hypothetical protein
VLAGAEEVAQVNVIANLDCQPPLTGHIEAKGLSPELPTAAQFVSHFAARHRASNAAHALIAARGTITAITTKKPHQHANAGGRGDCNGT